MSQSVGRRAVVVSPKLGRELRTKRTLLALVAVLSATVVGTSCSSLSAAGYNQSTTSTPSIAVSISPASPRMSPGDTVQFTASVSGTSNVGVVWTATGGTITGNGLFTSSKTAASATVTATSVADPKIFASTRPMFSGASPLVIMSSSLPVAS